MRHVRLLLLPLAAACGGDDEGGFPSERFEFQGTIHTVVISAATGSVSLTAAPGVVAAEFTPTQDGDNFQFEDSAGRLTLGSLCQDGSLGCGTSIAVTLPAGTDFEVKTESGPVSFAGMNVRGVVETTSGPIRGTELGTMILETSSLTADHTVSFDLVPQSVVMHGGSSGNLDLTVPPGAYQLDISAGGTTTTSGVQDGPSGPDVELTTGGNVTVTGA